MDSQTNEELQRLGIISSNKTNGVSWLNNLISNFIIGITLCVILLLVGWVLFQHYYFCGSDHYLNRALRDKLKVPANVYDAGNYIKMQANFRANFVRVFVSRKQVKLVIPLNFLFCFRSSISLEDYFDELLTRKSFSNFLTNHFPNFIFGQPKYGDRAIVIIGYPRQ